VRLQASLFFFFFFSTSLLSYISFISAYLYSLLSLTESYRALSSCILSYPVTLFRYLLIVASCKLSHLLPLPYNFSSVVLLNLTGISLLISLLVLSRYIVTYTPSFFTHPKNLNSPMPVDPESAPLVISTPPQTPKRLAAAPIPMFTPRNAARLFNSAHRDANSPALIDVTLAPGCELVIRGVGAANKGGDTGNSSEVYRRNPC
jgi:hypothetical protein